jgi:hypothetical protein
MTYVMSLCIPLMIHMMHCLICTRNTHKTFYAHACIHIHTHLHVHDLSSAGGVLDFNASIADLGILVVEKDSEKFSKEIAAYLEKLKVNFA